MSKPRAVHVAVVAALSAGGAGCDETTEPQPTPALSPSPSVSASAPRAVPLAEHVRAARDSGGAAFRAPSDEEREAYERWLEDVARAAWTDKLPGRLSPEGFVGRLADTGRLWLLREDARAKRGSGLVALRPSVGEELLIEAPHTFFEPGTLETALLAFELLEAKALLINTIHRGGIGSKEERRARALSGKSEADAAHNAKSLFATAHRALVSLEPDVTTVQFHGFADDRAPGVSVVLSPSRTKANAEFVREAIGPLVGRGKVKVFPEDIAVLGGTTNAEARASREVSSAFLHVEMARSFRDRLKNDTALRRRFVQALGEGIRNGRR